MRYDKTERLGVIETNRIVTKHLGWIFREQPIVDVGIDAIIEQSEKGNPTGKFIAAQIKTGDGNFHLSEKKIIYYVSRIHYNYWLNLDIPIILIAHFPDSKKTYWQQISEQNLRRTKKQWKIEIPRSQEFNEKAQNKLTRILSNNTKKSFVFELYKGKVEPDTIYDLVENVECISDSTISVLKIIDLINELRENTDNFNSKLSHFVNDGLSDKDSQVKASIKGYGRLLNITSKRIENEIELFSEVYSEGFYAFEQVVLMHYLITRDSQSIESTKQSIEKVPKAIIEALDGINVMRNGVFKLPKKYAVLKEAKMKLLDVIDMIINEFNEAKVMAENIIDNINRKN